MHDGGRRHLTGGARGDLEGIRDWLRDHPQAAEEYGKLKRGLAGRHRFDREAYRAGKVPFIDTVVAAARREAGAQSS